MIDLQNPSFLSSSHLHKVYVSVQEDYVVDTPELNAVLW